MPLVSSEMQQKHPSRSEIIEAIRKVAEHMETVGTAMDYYGGFDTKVAAHGREMIGAAQIARTWADGMELDHE